MGSQGLINQRNFKPLFRKERRFFYLEIFEESLENRLRSALGLFKVLAGRNNR